MAASNRRYYQFGLRALFLCVLVLSILFGLLAIRLQRARQQAANVATIRELGGEVFYDFETDPDLKAGVVPKSTVPEWLLAKLGYDFFHDVSQVDLGPAALPRRPEEISRCWRSVSELPRLEGLMAWRGWVDANALPPIGTQTNLRLLFFQDVTLNDADLEPLQKLRKLEELTLDGCPIGDEGAKFLSDFPMLTRLFLPRTQIGDEGAASISKNRSLEELQLDDTRVGDDGVREIARLRHLKVLSLNRTGVSDRGVAALAALPRLERLELNSTHVTGTAFQEFGSTSTLQRLCLGNCPITDEGALAIGNLPRLNFVDLRASANNSVTMDSLGQIHWPDVLEQIFFDGTQLNDEGLMRFVSYPKLRQIGVSRSKVTKAAADQFRKARPMVNVVGP